MDPFQVAADEQAASPSQDRLKEYLEQHRVLVLRQLELSEELDQVKKQVAALEMDTLPGLFNELRLTKLVRSDGLEMTLGLVINASLSDPAKAAEAAAFLRKHGADGLIKNEVSVSFGKGEDELSRALLASLRKSAKWRDRVEVKQTINTTSYKALVKELIEAGTSGAREAPGVFARDAVTPKLPTKKKGS